MINPSSACVLAPRFINSSQNPALVEEEVSLNDTATISAAGTGTGVEIKSAP